MKGLESAGAEDVGYVVGHAPRTSGLNAVMELSFVEPGMVDRAPEQPHMAAVDGHCSSNMTIGPDS